MLQAIADMLRTDDLIQYMVVTCDKQLQEDSELAVVGHAKSHVCKCCLVSLQCITEVTHQRQRWHFVWEQKVTCIACVLPPIPWLLAHRPRGPL